MLLSRAEVASHAPSAPQEAGSQLPQRRTLPLSARRGPARGHAESPASATAGPPWGPDSEAEVSSVGVKPVSGNRHRHRAAEFAGLKKGNLRSPHATRGHGTQVPVNSSAPAPAPSTSCPWLGPPGQGSIPTLSPGASLPDAGAAAGAKAPGVRTSTPPPFCQEAGLCSRLRARDRSPAGGGPFGNGREVGAGATIRWRGRRA